MNIRKYCSGISAAIAIILCAIACDDTTQDIGISVTDKSDHMEISTDTFNVATQSIAADSVFAITTIGYLGKVLDPETNAYVTGSYMTQFHTFEDYDLPEIAKMESKNENGEIIADSAELRLFFRKFSGDSLAPMKLIVYELNRPMDEAASYYSNYSPEKDGYYDANSFQIEKAYTLADQNLRPDQRADANHTPNIRIPLNKTYTDNNGKQYNNFGSYVIQKYYEDQSNFHNSYNFTQNVVHGFYFKHSAGLGALANIFATQLNIFFRYQTSADTVAVGTLQFTGTEEVLQTTSITTSKEAVKRLLDNKSCTYVKAPGGIFTEVTIPVDDITRGHEKDSLNTAQITFPRINDTQSNINSPAPPTTLLMIPKDSLYTFFEKQQVCNYKTSFVTSYASSANSYTFGNISNMVKEMYRNRGRSDNWNKAVLIPVTVQYNSTGEMTSCQHDMSMSSTRLIGGEQNTYAPIKISIIYGKFE